MADTTSQTTVALTGCPRCGGGHPTLAINPLVKASKVGDVSYTYWAACPATEQPLLVTAPMAGALSAI